MQAGKIIAAAAAVIAVGLIGLMLTIAGAVAVAITHASKDMRNWERWNDNDDRKERRE